MNYGWTLLKHPEKDNEFRFLHPDLLMLAGFISGFCARRNILFVITSMIRTPEENKRVKAKSQTHVQGRAFDFSIKKKHGWTDKYLSELFTYLGRLTNCKRLENGDDNPFYGIGALNLDLKQKVLIYHENANNEGHHAHVQVRPHEWFQKKQN